MAFFFVFISRLSAQEVLWANKVLEKSSETVDEKFSPKHRAVQVLGSPSVLPLAVSSACSWRPAGTSFGEDYIKVGFEKAIRVRQIIVGETVGPGAVGRIFGYTKDNREILLFENKGNNTRRKAGIWNEIIPETDQEIVAVKLLIVHSLNKGPKEYDCIGISASSEPFIARVNVAGGLPPDLEKINLGAAVNSRYSEVAPLVSPDGRYLYFTRLDHPKNYTLPNKNAEGEPSLDVWVSTLSKTGDWEAARNMSTSIHNSSKNAAATIAMDGKSIFALNVEVAPGKYDAGLTKVSLKNNKWVNKRPLKIADFEALSYYNQNDRKPKKETEFSMSSDEQFLVMGLVRKETYGDKDLYVSFRTGENAYSKPVNLGPVINTAGNEGSPFLAADNKTLYFNSNGHPGYGDMDIFMTTRLDDTWTNWSEPVNLGPHINSPQFDGYISIPASGEYAYFSSAKNSMGLDDLFKIRLFPGIKPEAVMMLDFKFVDKATKKELRPEISLQRSGNRMDFISDEETGFFKTVLQAGFTYELTARLEGYPPFRKSIDLRRATEYTELQEVYELETLATAAAAPLQNTETVISPPTRKESSPAAAVRETPVKKAGTEAGKEPESVADLVLEAGRKLVLKEVYFDQSKAEIREESYAELDRIRKIMVENPSMEILLEGHTDNQGDAALNFKLAEERITNVKNYLTADGKISPDRVAVKSWGQYRPLQKNTTEEARRKNRRVEFTITKM